MSWEWSHTSEAYGNAYANVRRLPREELLEILGEWRYYRREHRGITGPTPFKLHASILELDTDTLADMVWAFMEGYRRCSSGGWRAYACPDGCHTVSFDDGEDH
jgi:hypothetical protein